MSLTASEQATLYFYEWEYRNRGYYHFDNPIDIEPPYLPFQHRTYTNPVIDDGRVPSLFKSIGKLFTSPPEEQESLSLEPSFLKFDEQPTLVGFSISFPQGQEILPLRNIEFLNMLSFTTHLVSFEIVGTEDAITMQIVCSDIDSKRIQSHLKAYFPAIIIRSHNIKDFGFNLNQNIAIADFGIHDEFMRSIHTSESFSIDPLTSIIATLDSLEQGDIAVFQILFKGITSPLAKDITNAVSDGSGGSFFSDAPEMPKCAEDKISAPLFSVVMRIGTQGTSNKRSEYLAQELARSITSISHSKYNKLIPLSNEGYAYDFHEYNLRNRLSNRFGFLLNSKELNTFVHYPNKTIVSKKLNFSNRKTKKLPFEAMNQKYVLGINQHNGEENNASISDEIFSKHIVIGGSTGTGKTHLLKQLISFDLHFHNSTFVLDPHGDLISDILQTIPEEKKENVIYINLADTDYSYGFNIFSANTDAEKTVLASDLASAFADTWISSGDRIQSVLQKTISTFIYSTKEASILDMKRFLLEQSFRNEFLQILDDPILQYYWKNEFPLVRRNELSPLLLRIDSFMQTRLLRNIFCQTKGINFKELIEQRKLVLIQLSVGLIGLENSKFLARLIISKINQIAFSRQTISIEQRLPIHLYIDESHNYANSPVIEQILSGARKYNLNLVLVLQHLEQVQNDLLNSILTNTATQIFFRQNDKDGKRIASSFSYFEADDFMELDRGEALVRINKRSNDFNLKTLPLEQPISSKEVQDYIIQSSRTKYAQSKEYLSNLLTTLLPQKEARKEKDIKEDIQPTVVPIDVIESKDSILKEQVKPLEADTSLESKKDAYLKQEEEKEEIRHHRSLQNYVRALAQQRGFKTVIEEETETGGRVDIGLTQDDVRIAIEISVTNTLDYEVKNIQKCIDAEYTHVFMLSESMIHLKNIKARSKSSISKDSLKKVKYLTPLELPQHLDNLVPNKPKKDVKRIRGYRVKSNQIDINDTEAKEKNSALRNTILNSLKKRKK